MIGPMIACNVVDGVHVAENKEFQAYVPCVAEEVLNTHFYRHVPIYLKKIKKDLQRVGVWERALPCIASTHGVVFLMHVRACKRTGIGHGRVGVQAYR